MLDFKLIRDEKTQKLTILTSIEGKCLLTIPQLNKGTAFTQEERLAFGLLGKLPHRIETLEEQVRRAYLQYASYKSRLQQNIYLNNLHDKNQILFYKLVSDHLSEMLPTIYTPIVGTAVKRFSHEYRQPRGLYISHFEKHRMEEIISNRSNPDIDLIVVTDGEGVLGIGDQGIGGMDIPVAKLMVYTLCGGIDPTRTLPVFIDVGTNNEELLQDPLYLGCQHPRIGVQEYDDFILTFVTQIKKNFPQAFLHWEDFGRNNARRILDSFQDKICTFNDDIQGTGAVALAALLTACHITKLPLRDNRIIVFGAGTAGTGVSDQIVEAMLRQGLSKEEAYDRFWLIDKQGLLIEDDLELTNEQKLYARSSQDIQNWTYSGLTPSLLDTIREIKPTILIGCSAQSKAFSEEIVKLMSSSCERPIILPLSNPDEKCEADPADLIVWSKDKALIATGTPFPPINYENQTREIAQCNNALVFPGIGLGLLSVKATRLSKGMIWAAAETLSQYSSNNFYKTNRLLPSLHEAQLIAKKIAVSVAQAAIDENLASFLPDGDLSKFIEDNFWQPHYLPFKKNLPVKIQELVEI